MAHPLRRQKPTLEAETSPRRAPEEYLAPVEARLGSYPELVPTRDVCEFLGVTRQTVHNLLQTGELSGVRVSDGATRVFRESLRDYLRRNLV